MHVCLHYFFLTHFATVNWSEKKSRMKLKKNRWEVKRNEFHLKERTTKISLLLCLPCFDAHDLRCEQVHVCDLMSVANFNSGNLTILLYSSQIDLIFTLSPSKRFIQNSYASEHDHWRVNIPELALECEINFDTVDNISMGI